MALSRPYYAQAECALDDLSTTILAWKSMAFAIPMLLTGARTGTTGTSGAPPVGSRWVVDHSSDGATAGAPGDLNFRWPTAGVFDPAKLVRGASGAFAKSW